MPLFILFVDKRCINKRNFKKTIPFRLVVVQIAQK